MQELFYSLEINLVLLLLDKVDITIPFKIHKVKAGYLKQRKYN